MSTPENAQQPGTPQDGQSAASTPQGGQPAAATPPYAPAAPPHPQAAASAPPHPQAPAPSAPYAGPGAPPAPAAPRPRNNFGAVALVAGIAAIVLNFISIVNQAFQYANAMHDMSTIGTIQLTATIFMLVHGLLAVAAIVFGILGLAAKGRPKGAAGVGLGIGATALCATLGTVLYSSLISAMLGS